MNSSSNLFLINGLFRILSSFIPPTPPLPPTPAKFYKIDVTAGKGGEVTASARYVKEGGSVTLSARPDYGYKFLKWDDDETDNPRTITNIQDNITLAAVFKEKVPPTPPTPTADYLYFEAAEANSTVSMMSMLTTAPDLEYSTDGVTWQEWQHTTADGTHTFDTLTLTAVGDCVYLRGDNPNGFLDIENQKLSMFSMTGKIAAGGNVQSLVDGDTPTLVAKTMPMFSDFMMTETPSDVLVSTPFLPATTLAEYCYIGMFSGCTGITQAPNLPATTLAESCYSDMFIGCTGLTQTSNLPATTLAESCYYGMFNGCTGITQAPNLPATTLAESCYSEMFIDCEFNMSDDGTTFNFQCGATLPQTVGEETFTTPAELANWMGNTNGFN